MPVAAPTPHVGGAPSSGDLGSLVDLEDVWMRATTFAEPVSLTRLEDTFAASSWAETHHVHGGSAVDVSLGSIVINGRIDAVFRDDAEPLHGGRAGRQALSLVLPATAPPKRCSLPPTVLPFTALSMYSEPNTVNLPLPLETSVPRLLCAHDYTLWLDELAAGSSWSDSSMTSPASTGDSVEGIAGDGLRVQPDSTPAPHLPCLEKGDDQSLVNLPPHQLPRKESVAVSRRIGKSLRSLISSRIPPR
ncbi:MAG: hypothetical protein U1U88_002033 [Lawsonella clevelandensis]